MHAFAPHQAPYAPDVADASQQRTDERNHMFVVAVLYADGGSVPIRIRNMSRSGALIECAAIPAEGSPVRLSRGSLCVRGSVAWQTEDRAGIRFDGPVAVSDWLPRAGKPSGQQRVDSIVQACRQPRPPLGESHESPAALGKEEIVRQMLELKVALDEAADALANHPGAAASCPTALQTIDVTAQKLGKLAAFLTDEG